MGPPLLRWGLFCYKMACTVHLLDVTVLGDRFFYPHFGGDMKRAGSVTRKHVNKDRARRKFNYATQKTKAPNVMLGPMRGGIRF